MKSDGRSEAAPEQPVFGLGLFGFAPDERTLLESSLERSASMPSWRPSPFAEADAWWINGAKVRVLADGNLKVSPGLPTEHAIRLDLADVDRPVAFATPLAPEEFEPHWKFETSSVPSMHSILMQFDAWLWQQRAQFVLGARIIELGDQLRGGVYHVNNSGRLLAVLDFEQGRAAFRPRVHPVALWEADWDRRPIGAHDLPETFTVSTASELAWTYVRYTERSMLPQRYRESPVYFRQPPKVPLRWLRDSQLMVLRELSAEPCTLADLQQRTALPQERLERDLACLYYASSVTTTASKAAASRRGPPDSDGGTMDSVLRDPEHSLLNPDFTAPAPLGGMPRPRRRGES